MDLTDVDDFRESHHVNTKGALAAVVQLNRSFSEDTLPIDPDDYRTGKKGQVKGLGKDNCQKILEQHGIHRLLAAEAGRTSRGSMALMQDYAELINRIRPSTNQFSQIENYWIKHIRAFFDGKPFKLESDSSLSVDAAVEHLLHQAAQRQKENPGTMYVGTVLQHLVAAKLTIVAPDVEINGAAVADNPTGRDGDFNVGDTAIHCTTAPSSLLMEKCLGNIRNGLHPIIVTVRDRVKNAWDFASDLGFEDRLEVWDIQSFLSSNVHEHGRFTSEARHETLARLVDAYNTIIDECESDPGLHIEYAG
nr:DUF4928 family protein [Bifidobacterium catenulatum]